MSSTSRLDGRSPAGRGGVLDVFRVLPERGKSGLHRTRWWVTPTVRFRPAADADRESATERIPPASLVIRHWSFAFRSGLSPRTLVMGRHPRMTNDQ